MTWQVSNVNASMPVVCDLRMFYVHHRSVIIIVLIDLSLNINQMYPFLRF